jgi:hypothetical protein
MKFTKKNEVVLPGDIWEFHPSNDGRIWVVYVIEKCLPKSEFIEGNRFRVLLLTSPYDFPHDLYMDSLTISPNNYPVWKLLVRM